MVNRSNHPHPAAKPQPEAAVPAAPVAGEELDAHVSKTGRAKIEFADGVAVMGDMAITYDPDAEVADGLRRLVVGVDLRQEGLGGFSKIKGRVHVGPAHPVYVAVDLAHQDGATEAVVTGIDKDSPIHERLTTFLDEVKDQIAVTFA